MIKLKQRSNNIAGYKINIYISIAIIYKNDNKEENKMLEKTLFTLATEKIKYLGINLTINVQNLYKQKTLSTPRRHEIDLNKWKNIPILEWEVSTS